MPDDLTLTGKADDVRINIKQAHEIKFWSQKFGVSRKALRNAVSVVGPMVKDVEAYLATHN